MSIFVRNFLFSGALLLIVSLAVAQRSIVPAAPTVNDRFPKKSGSLRASTYSIFVGKVRSNESKPDTVFLFNEGPSPMKVKVVGSLKDPFTLPQELTFRPVEQTIAPGKEGFLVVSVDGRKTTELGFAMRRVRLLTDDRMQLLKDLTISYSVEEYFPPMTAEDSLNVQKARIGSASLDFGTVRSGEMAVVSTFICNDGKRRLLIRSASTPFPELKTSFSSMVVAPMDSVQLKLEYDTKGKSTGKAEHDISVFVNDPALPEIRIRFSGTIIQ